MARTTTAKKSETKSETKTPTRKSAAKTAAPSKAEAPSKAVAVPLGDGAEVVRIDRSRYEDTGVKSASGRKTVDNGDPLAVALRGKTYDEVVDIIKENGGEPNANWDNLNKGMARMSAGNVLRAMWRKANVLTIDGKKVRVPAVAA